MPLAGASRPGVSRFRNQIRPRPSMRGPLSCGPGARIPVLAGRAASRTSRPYAVGTEPRSCPSHDGRPLCRRRGIQGQWSRLRAPADRFLDRRRRRAGSAGGVINSPRDPAADGTGSCRVWRRTEQAVLKPLSHSRPVASGSMFVPGALTRNHGSESAPCLQHAQTCACCLQMEVSNPNKESLMCYRGMLCKQQVCDVPCLRRTQTRLRCQIQGLIGSRLPRGSTRQPRMRRLYRGWSGQGPASR